MARRSSLPVQRLVQKTPEPQKWTARMMQLAAFVASWSKDPSTKVGAVVVGRDRRMVAIGYNGFPEGIADYPERLMDREVKYKLTQHAERNVIDNAQFDLTGATLYVTMHPCTECSKSIVSKKIARVVCPPAISREPWASDAEWSKKILQEAGVSLEISGG